jgi:hypothetical protein
MPSSAAAASLWAACTKPNKLLVAHMRQDHIVSLSEGLKVAYAVKLTVMPKPP